MIAPTKSDPPPAASSPPAAPREKPAYLRKHVYLLFTVIALAGVTGRLLNLDSVDVLRLEDHLNRKVPDDQPEKLRDLRRPFLSANDRSRWCTVRSLVELHTYAIDDIQAEEGWDTIDMVKHRDTNGEPHLYSSKPPLMATLVAVPYWCIYEGSKLIYGKEEPVSLGTHPHLVGRILLFLIHVVPLGIYFVLMAWMIERYGGTDFGKLFTMAGAAFGTLLTTFAVTFNNHLPATVCVAAAVYAGLRIWNDNQRDLRFFAAAGFFGALAAAFELPAMSFFGLLGLGLLWKAPRQTLIAGVPAALVVLIASVTTNYISHGTIRPAYANRLKGDDFKKDNWEGRNWYNFTYKRGNSDREIQSYWNNPQGIDVGEPDTARYAFHALVGHHGIFSLTPLWLLMLVGLARSLANRQAELWPAYVMTAIASLVCFIFYLTPLADRNYGGASSGLRWMFWFAPLWLLAVLPAADWLGSKKWGRAVMYICLAVSVISVAYPTWNPWTQPWIQDAMDWWYPVYE